MCHAKIPMIYAKHRGSLHQRIGVAPEIRNTEEVCMQNMCKTLGSPDITNTEEACMRN